MTIVCYIPVVVFVLPSFVSVRVAKKRATRKEKLGAMAKGHGPWAFPCFPRKRQYDLHMSDDISIKTESVIKKQLFHIVACVRAFL